MSISLPDSLVLGTRGSPLALAQAREVQASLAAALGVALDHIALSLIKTTGDTIQDRALAEAGGKGLFTKELDASLLDGRIDLAVHSAKDMPTVLPEGLVIAGYLPREDVRDALISIKAKSLGELPSGAVVGTASLRRQAQVLRQRPDLKVTLLRGNVGTRIAKVESGEVDATLLALAGLKRLGLAHKAAAILDTGAFLPAIGQGAIAIITREQDVRTREALLRITHPETGVALAAERAFLRVLDGSCRTPIAGHARVEAGEVHFRGLVLAPDGSDAVAVERRGAATEAAELGEDAGREVVARARPALLGH
ncbi:hydroxymethylbilane synthase [Chelatococcus sp. SYSU_G07232]|uniref:Porphobilinogen deaminase n=1 Tax=Chelatococcus albus TaxID=3047466 RepID=A0ABT7AK84_9HYPH|nr:hydroxymethylbilane synthase [Chelatococcus sp. SYSU_G07232]MDJ1159784.1 hydroxymethylbilane synthase [Chelatococcus sp. SYSU_G07232]